MFGWINNNVVGIFIFAKRMTCFDQATALCDIFATCAAGIFDRVVRQLLLRLIPVHHRHLVTGTKVLVGRAVTVQTPPHAQGLVLEHACHLVDTTVTARTTHTSSDVYAVIEVRVVRQHMHTYPRDRLTRFVALANQL